MNPRSRGRILAATLLLAFCGFPASSALAQSSRGTISGIVQDATGGVLPNAEVTLFSPSTGVSVTVKTNNAGLYRFEAVLAGDYTVTVTDPGFKKEEATATVTAGSIVGREFKLSVGAVTEVTVSPSVGAELQTDDAVRSYVIPASALAELPIVGQSSLNLILTAPGVVRSNQSGSLDSGIGSVNGARARSNNFLLDGLSNNDISVNGPQYSITNNDELQEVSFQTSNFTAEYGRGGGAVVNQVTKSGSNSIHGTLATVYRSEVFNASTLNQRINFNNGATSVLKNKFKENIPAFTIGGPVYIPHIYDGRNKTFFFGAGQWDRYSSNSSTSFGAIPTVAGVATLQALAAACPNVASYLNLLGDVRGTTGVGSSSVDISLPTALASTSCSGGARTGQTVQVGTFVRGTPDIFLDNNHMFRLDHTVSQKQNMMVRWIYDLQTDNLGGNVGINSQYDVPFRGRTFGVAFNHTYVLRSNLVNEFRFGYTRSNLGYFLPNPNSLAGTTPDTSITSLSNLTLSATFPQGRISNNFQYQDTVSYTKSRHTVRAGIEFTRQLAVQVAPFNSRGTVAYSNVNGAGNAFVSNTTITGLANFIDNFGGSNGGPVNIVFGSGKYRPNLFTITGFAQDTYKASPNLTLTYGLRYENFGQPANQFPHPAFVGFGDADISSTAKVNQDNNNFGPSVGFAYNPHFSDHGFGNGSMVIRGGYAVSYDTFFNNLLSNMAAASPNALANIAQPSSSSALTPRGTPNLSAVLPTLVPTPLNPYSSASSLFSQNIKNPYYHRFSFGIQQQLPANVVLDVAYVGTLGRQLFFTNPLNPALPNSTFTGIASQTTTLYGSQTLRLHANRGLVQLRDSGLTSNYNALQVQLRRRAIKTMAGNLSFNSSYTWSKNLDILTETFATNSSPQNPSRSPAWGTALRDLDYGPADNDRRHVSVTTLQLQVRGVTNRFLNEFVGGWSLIPILTVQSGTPYTVIDGADRDLDGSSLGDRPNISNIKAPKNTRGGPVAASVCASLIQNLDTKACVTANDVYQVQVPGYSPTSPLITARNSAFTTRYLDLDTNILKTFKVTERVGAELRGEFFNITNNANFDTPASATNRNITAATAGNYLNQYLVTTNGTGRTFRVGAKIKF